MKNSRLVNNDQIPVLFEAAVYHIPNEIRSMEIHNKSLILLTVYINNSLHLNTLKSIVAANVTEKRFCFIR